MKTASFAHALLPEGWSGPVEIDTDESVIHAIRPQVKGRASLDEAPVQRIAVPGMVNVHSHAFQFAFAGLSEFRTQAHDSFWTWRQQMYGFLETLSPDDVYRIGSKLYRVMRSAGYAAVGEFHYLHHQPGGQPYGSVTAMADALLQAALDTGMKICLLPVLYQRGGFDDRPLSGGQLRFQNTLDQYVSMLEKLAADWLPHPSIRVGVAIHSLRAVSIASMRSALASVDAILGECPIHIHIAEQQQEVDDCLDLCGQRPVELLLNEFDVGTRWCLIHATHMTDSECRAVADRGAIIGVCPTTEANLGDGIFMAEAFLHAGGRLAIGSDSHITIDPCEELRMLEYAQRLTKQRRAVLCTDDQSCGTLLYRWAAENGAAAIGFGRGELQPRQPDLIGQIELPNDSDVPIDRLLDYVIFHSSPETRSLRA